MRDESSPESDSLLEIEAQETPNLSRHNRQLMAEAQHEAMLKKIRSWAYWLLGIGAISLIASGFLDPSWGILLIVVGLASFLFKDAAMFVIYGITLIWAAIMNTIGGIDGQEWGWAAFSIIQVYIAVRTFMMHARFRKAQADWDEMISSSDGRSPVLSGAARVFPTAGCALSALALLGVVAMVIATVVMIDVLATEKVSSYYAVGLGLVIDLGVLGLAVNLASLLSHFRHKALSILGAIGSSIVLVLFLILLFLPE